MKEKIPFSSHAENFAKLFSFSVFFFGAIETINYESLIIRWDRFNVSANTHLNHFSIKGWRGNLLSAIVPRKSLQSWFLHIVEHWVELKALYEITLKSTNRKLIRWTLLDFIFFSALDKKFFASLKIAKKGVSFESFSLQKTFYEKPLLNAL